MAKFVCNCTQFDLLKIDSSLSYPLVSDNTTLAIDLINFDI